MSSSIDQETILRANQAILTALDTMPATVREERLEFLKSDKPIKNPPLAVVLFGIDAKDARQRRWCEVSKPWGLGTMNALVTIGAMSKYYREHIDRLDNRKARRALAYVYQEADSNGEAGAFNEWVRSRLYDPLGMELIGARPTRITREGLRERITEKLNRLSIDDLRVIERVATSLPDEEIPF